MFGSGSVNLGSAHGTIAISLEQVGRDFDRTVQTFDRRLAQSFQSAGQNLQNLGGGLTQLFAPLTAFTVSGVMAFAKFDDVMIEIAARTGATATQMELLRNEALRMGQETAFSALEAGDAMLQLLAAGNSTEATLAALPAVLDLAAAGAVDLGRAADSVTDIMNMFRMEGTDAAGQVADAIARAAGSSSANVNMLLDSFGNIGPIAADMGLSIEETAAVLAVFADNSIKGSMAGTQLRSMLNNMGRDTPKVRRAWERLGTSMFDAEGNMRPLNTVIWEMNHAMEDMSDEERNSIIRDLAGTYGQMGLSALLAAGGISEQMEAMERAASASDVARARLSSLRGVFNQLKATVETISINVLGPLVDEYLTPMIQRTTEFLNKINEWLVANPKLAATIGMVIAGLSFIGPALMIAGRMLSAFGTVLGGVFGIARFALGGIAALFSPVGLAIAGVVGAVLLMRRAWEENLGGIRDALGPVVTFVQRQMEHMSFWLGSIFRVFEADGWQAALNQARGVFRMFFDDIREALGMIDLGMIAAVFRGLGAALLGALSDGVGLLGQAAGWVRDNIVTPLGNAIRGFVDDGGLKDASAALGLFIARQIGNGIDLINNAVTWVRDNILRPIWTELINARDNGNLRRQAEELGRRIPVLIAGGIGLIGQAAAWVRDNILRPIWTELINAQLDVNLRRQAEALGARIPVLIAGGIGLIGQAAAWVRDNILRPIWTELISARLDVNLRRQAEELGRRIPVLIAGGIGLIGQAAAWVRDNVITPIANKLIELQTDETLIGGAEALGRAIPPLIGNAMKALLNIQWVIDNTISPIASQLDNSQNNPNLIRAAMDLGQAIAAAIGRGLREIIMDEIRKALPGGGDVPAEFTAPYETPGEMGPTYGDDLPPGYAPKRDSGGPGVAGGMYRIGSRAMGSEAFIPGDRGYFYPDFARNLARVAGMVLGGGGAPLAEGLGGGGGGRGDVYHIEVSVPVEVLRNEPGLQRNGERFGEALLMRMRSR